MKDIDSFYCFFFAEWQCDDIAIERIVAQTQTQTESLKNAQHDSYFGHNMVNGLEKRKPSTLQLHMNTILWKNDIEFNMCISLTVPVPVPLPMHVLFMFNIKSDITE